MKRNEFLSLPTWQIILLPQKQEFPLLETLYVSNLEPRQHKEGEMKTKPRRLES